MTAPTLAQPSEELASAIEGLIVAAYEDAGCRSRWTGMSAQQRRNKVLHVWTQARAGQAALVLSAGGMDHEINASRLIPDSDRLDAADVVASIQARADALDHSAIERALAARWHATGAGTAWDTTPRRARDGMVRFAAYMLAQTGEALARTTRDGTRHLITLDDYEQHREQS